MFKPQDHNLKTERDQRKARYQSQAGRLEARRERQVERSAAPSQPPRRKAEAPRGPLGATGEHVVNVHGRVPTGRRGKDNGQKDGPQYQGGVNQSQLRVKTDGDADSR